MWTTWLWHHWTGQTAIGSRSLWTASQGRSCCLALASAEWVFNHFTFSQVFFFNLESILEKSASIITTCACPDCWTSFPSIVISQSTVNCCMVNQINRLIGILWVRFQIQYLISFSQLSPCHQGWFDYSAGPVAAGWKSYIPHKDFQNRWPHLKARWMLSYSKCSPHLCGINLAARSPNIGLPICVSDSCNTISFFSMACHMFISPPWSIFSSGRLFRHWWRLHWTQSCQRMWQSGICQGNGVIID